jgi:hypothetical protein
MDLQTAFNIAAGVISIFGGLAGWHLKGINDRLKEIEKKNASQDEALAAVRELLPTIYVRRDDFSKVIDALFDALRRIEDKLDTKVDKP